MNEETQNEAVTKSPEDIALEWLRNDFIGFFGPPNRWTPETRERYHLEGGSLIRFVRDCWPVPMGAAHCGKDGK